MDTKRIEDAIKSLGIQMADGFKGVSKRLDTFETKVDKMARDLKEVREGLGYENKEGLEKAMRGLSPKKPLRQVAKGK